ncbi:polysaccharide deacetylase family protein [Neptunomonas marina]|uniref:NodB homology domain-containing protein n=1 Tax=Neptunomonas marina TaxID=1815562 RepID=A0A437Q5C2_9GAMM|nr:polysaccharide deacetylase family protein [Neptunomonas marina]RVU29701.1 hypothetical protein EOE65_14190 [Neptunomonas marina]
MAVSLRDLKRRRVSKPVEAVLVSLLMAAGSTSLAADEKRIAIVYSDESAEQFYDKFAYQQLFAASQYQATMAGIPFDLINAAELTQSEQLKRYSAILMPNLSHIQADWREAIEASLAEATAAGVSLITAGNFLTNDADGNVLAGNPYRATENLLQLSYSQYFGGVAASVTTSAAPHPVIDQYGTNQAVVDYGQLWFNSYQPLTTHAHDLVSVAVNGSTVTGGWALDHGDYRVVHFSNEQVMMDNNLLWRALQWATYGSQEAVGLQMTRADSLFYARNDMDQSMFANTLHNTDIPLLDIVTTWQKDYDFVGSFYLNIGNNPAAGEYTDWSVSAPLFQAYADLGNGIGSHSYTHPHHTTELTDEELVFEFKDSAQVLRDNLQLPVIGAAVPGNPEDERVRTEMKKHYKYISGRTGDIGSGYRGAFGKLTDKDTSLYFSLNMSPDYTLIQYLNQTPAQALATWKQEFDALTRYGSAPIANWLWHDYAVTNSADLYGTNTLRDLVAYAAEQGTEFITGEGLYQRLEQFANTRLDSEKTADGWRVSVAGNDIGHFALKLTADTQIAAVANWYAYNTNEVFVPRQGGTFEIKTGGQPSAVTRITDLPTRAELIDVTGDGQQLAFTLQGQGDVVVTLASSAPVTVLGASSYQQQGEQLVITLAHAAQHTVTVKPTVVETKACYLKDLYSNKYLEDYNGYYVALSAKKTKRTEWQLERYGSRYVRIRSVNSQRYLSAASRYYPVLSSTPHRYRASWRFYEGSQSTKIRNRGYGRYLRARNYYQIDLTSYSSHSEWVFEGDCAIK